MRALALALLYLGSVSLLGLEAAKLDLASDFKRKWSRWEQQRRARRALPSPLSGAAPAPEATLLPASVRTQEAQQQQQQQPPGGRALGSRPEAPLPSRARRSPPRQGGLLPPPAAAPAPAQLRSGCRLGTCNTAHLAHRIFHLTDKDKDSTAPAAKLSAHGYGRRRRKRRRRR